MHKPQSAPRAVQACEARSTPPASPYQGKAPEIEERLALEAQLGQQADQLEHLERELTEREQTLAQLREVLGASAHEDVVERAALLMKKLNRAPIALRIAATSAETHGNAQGAELLRRAAAEVAL